MSGGQGAEHSSSAQLPSLDTFPRKAPGADGTFSALREEVAGGTRPTQ